MSYAICQILRFYHWGLSPFLGPHCRFAPSCSLYLQEAIMKKGLARGLWLGVRRLLCCHPFSSGGYDPLDRES